MKSSGLPIGLLSTLLLCGQGCASWNESGLPPGVHRLSPAAEAGIVIRGQKNRTYDFTGVTLRGADEGTLPDQFKGTAVLVEDSENITIKGLKAQGYRIAVLARRVPGLRIEGCDFSDNYRPRLKSTKEKEHNDDWLFFHHNEKDEWLRYAAAIYLTDCPYPVIKGNTVERGFNALLMTRCERGLIANNTFIFNSGLGIGMYRSSYNAVMHNRLDFNVRGYSHGVYSRGQDSAAILIYEQSNNNLFAFNSATHSGDGFFLWAGQTTMDTGQGGCNDNLLYANDFSHAPTNGIEATFSRNYFISNQIDECDHGIWAGYSYDSVFANNTLANNRYGFMIERGQHNTITDNVMLNNGTAIRLFTRAEPKDWGYPKQRDTRSVGYFIAFNRISAVPASSAPAIILTNTTDVTLANNLFRGYSSIRADSPTAITWAKAEKGDVFQSLISRVVRPLPDALDTTYPNNWPRGRRFIEIDEWGPKDIRPAK